MLNEVYLRTARQTDAALTRTDLLHFCSDRLAKPIISGDSGSSGDFLLKKNMFLQQSIFVHWKNQFTLILENVGSMPSYGRQQRAFLSHLLREVEWRATHETLVSKDATSNRDLVKTALDGVDWFMDEEASSYEYVLDTRKWVSNLMMPCLDDVLDELYPLASSTRGRMAAYQKEWSAVTAKKIEAVSLGQTLGARAYKKAQGLLKHYALVLADMKESVVEQGSRTVTRSDFEPLDEQWKELREPVPRPERPRLRA